MLEISKPFMEAGDFVPYRKLTFEYKFSVEQQQDCKVIHGKGYFENLLIEKLVTEFRDALLTMEEHQEVSKYL